METFFIKDNYYIYISTNKARTLLETGVAGSLSVQLTQWKNIMYNASLTTEDACIYLLYWESFSDMHQALKREKEIKKWTQKKKTAWISDKNPEWHFLNETFSDQLNLHEQ